MDREVQSASCKNKLINSSESVIINSNDVCDTVTPRSSAGRR